MTNSRILLAGIFALTPTMICARVSTAQEQSSGMGKIERLNRAPVNTEVLKVQLPRPTVVKLPNGLTVVLLEDHKLPTIAFSMWIRPGQLADPQDLPGLASFTADMLTEGTTRRSSSQIATEIDSLGASLTAQSEFGVSYTAVSASGLIDSATKILDLMSDVVLHPDFPDTELAKYKQRELANLDQQLSSPDFLAVAALNRVLYQGSVASVTSPTKESIDKVTCRDLKRFHEQHYVPGNTILGATGDFNISEMRDSIAKYFGSWTGAAEPSLKVSVGAAPQSMKITLVDRPGSVQTFVIAGDRAIRRADADYYALSVMNEVLGAGPQSRLFLDLREVHGYTYGSYSDFQADTYPGHWAATAPVRTQVTDAAMTQFLYEFKKINNETVSPGELGDAERAIVGQFALSLERPATLLSDWLTVEYFGLPANYWDDYSEHIDAVEAAGIQQAAKKYVNLEHLQWICVGDRKQIESVVSKYGPVTVVDVNGKVE
jgi:zinc protease